MCGKAYLSDFSKFIHLFLAEDFRLAFPGEGGEKIVHKICGGKADWYFPLIYFFVFHTKNRICSFFRQMTLLTKSTMCV